MYQPKNSASPDAMAKLCGLPGKMGMDGSAVYPAYFYPISRIGASTFARGPETIAR